MAEKKQNRIGLMDDLRGFCVLCMIFYHGFLLAFSSFGVVAGGQAYDFFRPVQPFFAGTFILLCGISCRLSHSNRDRGLKLLAVALAINLITILGLPRLKPLGFDFSGSEIWFGILDLLAACTVAAIAATIVAASAKAQSTKQPDEATTQQHSQDT